MDESVPSSLLRNVAEELTKSGDAVSARRVLEFLYSGELKAGRFDASNFLGLAEIRLEEGDTAAAVALLRRAALVANTIGGSIRNPIGGPISGAAFSTLEPSAALLERTGHAVEAVAFLADLVKAEPWNWEARERLAADRADASSVDALIIIAKSTEATYATRVAAALGLRKMKAAPLAGTDAELVLLSSQDALTDAVVSKPYFVASRLQAAASQVAPATTSGTTAARVKLLAGAIAIDPRAEAKFALFRAALETRQDALAIAIASEILPPYLMNEGEFMPWVAEQFASNLAHADRVTIALGLGNAHQRLGDQRAALRSFQIAQQLQPTATTRRAIDTIRAQTEIDTKNNARRPVVTDHLDQDRLVHPMLRVAAR
jgi:tetratricopeptide (TPR) repeat protein